MPRLSSSRLGCAVLCALVVALLGVPPVQAKPAVTFAPKKLDVTLPPATSTFEQVVVHASETLEGVSFEVTPSLEGIVTVPVLDDDLLSAGENTLTFGLHVPSTASINSAISGTIHLRQSGSTVSRPLPVKIKVAEEPGDPGDPFVSLLAPLEGDYLTGAVELVASVVGLGAGVTVEFLVDGELMTTVTNADADGLYRAEWDSTTGTGGPRALWAVAEDASGEMVESDVTLVDVSNELEFGLVSAFVLSEAVPVSQLAEVLRAAAVRPVAFDHLEPMRGGYYSWVLSLDTAVALYRSSYEARHGVEPQVFAFTVHGELDASALGDLEDLVVEEGVFDGSDTLAFTSESDDEPAGIATVDSAVSSSETSEVTPLANGNWWPDRGSLVGFEDTTELDPWWPWPFPDTVTINTRVIEHTLVWDEHSTQSFDDQRAYEHGMRLYSEGRSGVRPVCNPFSENHFWIDKSWTSWETSFPSDAKPYFDADVNLLIGYDASISDGCDEADMTVGVLRPREVPDGEEIIIRTEARHGAHDISPIAVVPQNSGIYCGPIRNRWCVGLNPSQSEYQPAIGKSAEETLPGCYEYEWDGEIYDHRSCDVITFSEFPLNTQVTDEYAPWGVLFDGDQPIIVNDGANPTSPVLSGQPIFSGDIEMTFVEPGSDTPTTVSEVSFDIGYVNSPGAVIVHWYGADGSLLGSEPVMELAIPRVEISESGIARVFVEVTPDEPAGAAIDNLEFR